MYRPPEEEEADERLSKKLLKREKQRQLNGEKKEKWDKEFFGDTKKTSTKGSNAAKEGAIPVGTSVLALFTGPHEWPRRLEERFSTREEDYSYQMCPGLNYRARVVAVHQNEEGGIVYALDWENGSSSCSDLSTEDKDMERRAWEEFERLGQVKLDDEKLDSCAECPSCPTPDTPRLRTDRFISSDSCYPCKLRQMYPNRVQPAEHVFTQTFEAKLGREKEHVHLADLIILESHLDPIDLPGEYRTICIIMLMVVMFGICMPVGGVVAWIFLELRMKFNFWSFTEAFKRPIPHKPVPDKTNGEIDITGGYRKWLVFQCYLSTIVASLLFVTATGHLEAWWSAFVPEDCSLPQLPLGGYNNTIVNGVVKTWVDGVLTEQPRGTRWKYPACDMTYTAPKEWPDYDEKSESQAWETMDPNILSTNDKCWDRSTPRPDVCPFVQGESFILENKRTTRQSM